MKTNVLGVQYDNVTMAEALDTARIRALNADCAMFRLRAQQYLTAAAALDARATPGLVYPEDREAARRNSARRARARSPAGASGCF